MIPAWRCRWPFGENAHQLPGGAETGVHHAGCECTVQAPHLRCNADNVNTQWRRSRLSTRLHNSSHSGHQRASRLLPQTACDLKPRTPGAGRQAWRRTCPAGPPWRPPTTPPRCRSAASHAVLHQYMPPRRITQHAPRKHRQSSSFYVMRDPPCDDKLTRPTTVCWDVRV